jgi:glycosyltransferase involved in cell wall biosynthesis
VTAAGQGTTILRDSSRAPEGNQLAFQDLRRLLRQAPWRWLFRLDQVRLLTYSLRHMSRPFLTALVLRLLSRGPCLLEDEAGRRQRVTPWTLGQLLFRLLRALVRGPRVLRQVERELDALEAGLNAALPRQLDPKGTPAYLRTDLVFGLRSGGSVGHTAGVLNHLQDFLPPPLFLTSDPLPTVRADVETRVLPPGRANWDFPDLPRLAYNQRFTHRAGEILCGRRLAFLYQRYSLGNFSGVALARQFGVPLVVEYNGPEVWVTKNWGRRLPRRHEALAERIEWLNLRAADLVVVVSEPLREDLLARGLAGDRVLVNPNGVDPERYSPAVDGTAVRVRHSLEGQVVIGFIGTFGRWHGAEVLAEAFGRLLRERPEYRQRVRLLLIGDGVMMPEVRARLEQEGVGPECVCTGLVPQEQGPEHLAACDVLVSPHVPNPDGSKFFGSPTKLFEYMAMGRGIVASDLAQIGEVLRHDRTAWLVPPGEARVLANGLEVLVGDENRRRRLGAAARSEAVARYTWREHTRRIVARLTEVCGSREKRERLSA